MRPRRPLLAALVLALTLLPAAARPAAWPREPGAVFLSFKGEDGGRDHASGSLYGEYGLTPRLTLTGQLSRDGGSDREVRLGGTLRYALSAHDAVHRFAVSLGGSAPPTALGAATRARAEMGLHWGRGFSSRYGDGWVTATARLMIARDEARPVTDLHALAGLRPFEGWMAMLSAGRYADEDGVTYKISPSAGYRLREGVWIVPSLTRDLTASDTGLGLAVWLEF